MATATSEQEYTSFMVKNEEFVVVPKKEFQRLTSQDEYPKLYTEVDEEGTWETIDFWPEGIDSKELISHLKS